MDYSKPTAQMLGRYQPWHDGHTALFKSAHHMVGQVCIMVRTSESNKNNPYPYTTVHDRICNVLTTLGYDKDDYNVIAVPNITDISYGRDVGYTFTEHDLGDEIHAISATNIREKHAQILGTDFLV